MIYKINNEPSFFMFGKGDILLTVGKVGEEKEPSLLFSTSKKRKIGRIRNNVKVKKSELHTVFQFENIESIDAIIDALKDLKKLKASK